MTATPIILKRSILLILLGLLAACQMFAPAYDEQVGSETTQAYTALGQLLSEADYGKFRTPDTFAAAIDRYAQIDALLGTAALRAESLPVSKAPARRARDLLVGQIAGCRSRVKTLAGIHQRAGIAPDAGLTDNARVSCDLAARAATAMQ
jgi:hypothetical protein